MSDEIVDKPTSEPDNCASVAATSHEKHCGETNIISISTSEKKSVDNQCTAPCSETDVNNELLPNISEPTVETPSELSSEQATMAKPTSEKVTTKQVDTGASLMNLVDSQEVKEPSCSVIGDDAVADSLSKSACQDASAVPQIADECSVGKVSEVPTSNIVHPVISEVKEETGLKTHERSEEEMDVDEGVSSSTTMVTAELENALGLDEVTENTLETDRALMGYSFNEDGELKDERGQRFEFKVYEDHFKNQRRYERLGEMITDHIYSLLETECNLHRMYLPVDAADGEPTSFIFVSDKALTTTDKLLVLIHGTGVVRAGQWARRLIINENLDKGTQIPYIKRAVDLGYEVMVLNTNLNRVEPSTPDDNRPIRGSESAEAHGTYVWENVIEPQVKAKHIAIVAHSYGGVVTTELALTKTSEFLKRVFAVGFTDSVHSLMYHSSSTEVPRDVLNFYLNHVKNWVSSNKPLDEPSKIFRRDDAPRVSAGHPQHEWTSWACMESVFKFLEEQLAEHGKDSSQSNSDNSRCTTV